MSTSWQLDEVDYAGAEHLDADFVARYDRKQGYPDSAEDLAVFHAQGLGETSTIVDLGTGTGRFALAAARRFGRIIAVDVSPVMLAHVRDRAATGGLGNVDVVRAGFLSYEHPGAPVDGVFTRNALHQLPDFWKALALERISIMLRPGGVLRLHDLIYDFQPARTGEVFEQWFDHAADDPAQGYTREDFADHIRTEHSTFRWILEPMLVATGFEIVDAEYRQAVYGTYTCIRRASA